MKKTQITIQLANGDKVVFDKTEVTDEVYTGIVENACHAEPLFISGFVHGKLTIVRGDFARNSIITFGT